MDMDHRTRFLGGGRQGGRIILLGDGTEIHTTAGPDDDGDVDMEDRGEAVEADSEEEKDLAEQVRRGQRKAKDGVDAGKGEPTKLDASTSTTEGEGNPSKSSDVNQTPDEPKMTAATDSADSKKVAEELQK